MNGIPNLILISFIRLCFISIKYHIYIKLFINTFETQQKLLMIFNPYF